jgi:Tol biopolymer transport system component/DNA-binding winged helix-turn-helix (wHTH) protein
MHPPAKQVYEFGPFLLDTDQRILLRDEQIVPLTPKSFETLLVLVESSGRVLDKEELLRRVWPNTFVEEVNLAKNISILRKTFGEDSVHPYIQTIPKRGYRFVAPVREVTKANGGVGHVLKQPSRHFQYEEDLKAPAPLENLAPAGGLQVATAPAVGSSLPALARLSAFLIVGAITGLVVWMLAFRSSSRSSQPPLDANPLTSFPGQQTQAAFSPDGKQIVFVWNGPQGGTSNIYIKLIGTETPLRLTNGPWSDTKPVWSPDGRYIVFVRTSAQVRGYYMISALGGPERKLADVFPSGDLGTGNSPYFSPDGKYLAIVNKLSQAEPSSIFLLSLENGQTGRLTSPPAGTVGDYCPGFSPDGKSLAFIRSTSLSTTDLYVLQLPGGEPRQLTFDGLTIQGVAWTRASREIIFSSRRGGGISYLWRISSAGGTPQRVNTVGKEVLSPAVSAQGNRLAYTQALDDMNIWRIELDAKGKAASETELIFSTFWDGDPDYSPDGQKVAFTSGRSGGFGIWVSDSDGSNPRLLFDGGSYLTGTPRWSPDGRWIAFDSRLKAPATGSNPDIYVISADGGKPFRLTTDPAEDVAPSWSRDGTWVYFGSTRSGTMQAWKIPAVGGVARQITRQGGFEGFESVDAKYLYYLKGRGIPGIWRVPVEGGDEVPVITMHRAGLWRYWRIVAGGIYFATTPTLGHPLIEFFSFATGQSTEVATRQRGPDMYTPGLAVSPDGRYVLYCQKDQSGGNIMMVDNFR